MKFLITVGGTGGHLFPAQALAKKLISIDKSTQLLFVGGGLSTNKYFDRKSFPYKDIPCATLSLRAPWKSFLKVFRLVKGIARSISIIRTFRPNVVVGFGSYYTFPTLFAASLMKTPYVLHEANAVPGKVNRFFSARAKVTGIHFPESAAYFKGKTIEVGMPLREGYTLKGSSREQAKLFFNLDPSTFTFLIFGGSQGASAINRLVGDSLGMVRKRYQEFQVLHFTGSAPACRELQNLYERMKIRSTVRDFETHMNLAWLAGDLVVSRAGASSIAEQIEMEVPGILIPYPYATEHHQDKNADFMVRDVKGAVKVLEKQLTPINLSKVILDLVANDRKRLKEMARSISHYKEHTHHPDLCSIVCKVAEGRNP